MGVRAAHDMHMTSRMVPWISTTRPGSLPAAWCRPSTFWATRVWSVPRR